MAKTTKKGSAPVKLTLKRPTIYTLPTGTRLYPGPDQSNVITAEEWDKCKDHPVVRAWVREGHVVVDGSKAVVPGPPSPQEFRTRPSGEAIALISGCDDAAQIRAWVEADPRKTVRRAGQQRLVEMQSEGNLQAQVGDYMASKASGAEEELDVVTDDEIAKLGDGPVQE